jgi:hypothetical protein
MKKMKKVVVASIVGAFVLAMTPLAVGMALRELGAAGGGTGASTVTGGPVSAAPAWDDDILRSCQEGCSVLVTKPAQYNACYACWCLSMAAETPEEQISAEAQCQAALRDRRVL